MLQCKTLYLNAYYLRNSYLMTRQKDISSRRNTKVGNHRQCFNTRILQENRKQCYFDSIDTLTAHYCFAG